MRTKQSFSRYVACINTGCAASSKQKTKWGEGEDSLIHCMASCTIVDHGILTMP